MIGVVEPLAVVAGLLTDACGRVLLAARPAGKAMAGRWEFPGGKVDPGETDPQALVRELHEELGVIAREVDCVHLHTVTFRYPGAARAVRIAAYRVHRYAGAPQGREGQALAWHPIVALAEVDILEADRPIVTALRLGSVVVLADLPSHVRLVHHPEPRTPTGDPRSLTGLWLPEPRRAAEAVAAGVDFLLMTGAPDGPACDALRACGLPWYVPEGRYAPAATGAWRDGHLSVATSIPTSASASSATTTP